MTMTLEPGDPQSVSTFLRSYSPDTFEWENPYYEPRRIFVWSRPLTLAAQGSFPVHSANRDAALCDGGSSPGSESLSDMSISLSDTGSGILFSIPPPMNRTRATSVSPSRPLALNSDASSLSDMSISPVPSISSPSPEDFEHFVGNMPTQRSWNRPARASFPEGRFHLPDSGSVKCSAYSSDTRGLDSNAIVRILEWTTSLFTSIASSTLDYTIHPDEGGDRTETIHQDTSSFWDEERSFSPRTKDVDSDIYPLPAKIIVRINSSHTRGPIWLIQANPASICMPSVIDYQATNSEQPTTAKPVCMWGRRLERIPKVRLAGQEEAVYCFDSRKQRQKQKGSTMGVAPPIRHVMGNFSCNEERKPTQIFYRARPLGAPLIRRTLPAAPVDAVKITQGQVLLQNIAPVRFINASLPQRGFAKESPRLPFAPRNNWADTGYRAEGASSLLLKKIPGCGFL